MGQGLNSIGRAHAARHSSGRDCGHELRSSSPLKEGMKVLGDAVGESWVGQSSEAAPGFLLLSRSPWLELGEVGVGQLTPGPAVGEAKRTKAIHRNVFSRLSLVFPDHVQGRILLAVSSASL